MPSTRIPTPQNNSWRSGRLVPVSDPNSPRPLFAYGTLQFPEVLECLIGRAPQMQPVAVCGWRAATLPGLVYPGLVASESSTAIGVLLEGLTDHEWSIIDAFENATYRLAKVPVHPTKEAWAYLWTGAADPDDWNREIFAATSIGDYLDRCTRWKAANSAG